MSKNSAPRIDVGECDLGSVFIHSFAGTPVAGRPTRERFEVRAGNRTIGTKGTLAEAQALANALCGINPEPPDEGGDGLAPQKKGKKAK